MLDLNAPIPETVVHKFADESRVNATATNDTELLFNAVTESWYDFEMCLQVTGTAGLGGLRIGLSLPTNAEAVINTRSNVNTSANTATNANVIISVIPAASTLATQIVTVSGKIRTSSTAGVVALSWAQNTAAGANPVVIKAGSKLIYKKV